MSSHRTVAVLVCSMAAFDRDDAWGWARVRRGITAHALICSLFAALHFVSTVHTFAAEPTSRPMASVAPTTAPSGLFPKMPAAPIAYVVSPRGDDKDARMTCLALQGLINQRSAEVYVLTNPWHMDQLKASGHPFEVLERMPGENGALRALFRKYRGSIKKMVVYDPEKDWTWYLALMIAAQQDGLPVTPAIQKSLVTELGWTGQVDDLRDRWASGPKAYEWALANLMPHCSKQVVFAVRYEKPLADYVAATKGFVFWLNFRTEQPQINKIFQTKGYAVGTSLMGYANSGDDANAIANQHGIGYVVSDFYANGSFWSSFPNKAYTQTRGQVIDAQPGKIYASIMWSDGDNLSFDQNPLYLFWKERARGTVPVATSISPTLQELNPPLLDWYYAQLKENDELVAGPAGVQFIFVKDYPERLFLAWCHLTRDWCGGAGLHSARIWVAPIGSPNYNTFMRSCGFDGVLGEGWSIKPGLPPKIDALSASDEEELYKQFLSVQPKANAPVFVNFTPIVEGFNKKNGGYAAIQRQVDRVEAAYPGRYVFVLPKDQFATIRATYNTKTPEVVGGPDVRQPGVSALDIGDGHFEIVERAGSRCWHAAKDKYLYFEVDDRFLAQPGQPLEIQFEYFDNGVAEIGLEYDSTDSRLPLGGAYKPHRNVVHRAAGGKWKVARITVSDANLAGRQNGGADFRLSTGGDDLFVHAARVRRIAK